MHAEQSAPHNYSKLCPLAHTNTHEFIQAYFIQNTPAFVRIKSFK